MTTTHIKNIGRTKTTITNGKKSVNVIDWDMDYDGKRANISMDVYDNHTHDHYDFKLNNDDLEQLLNIPSVNMGLENRLIEDFKKNTPHSMNPFVYLEQDSVNNNSKTHLSSPLLGEDILLPNTIDNKRSHSVKQLTSHTPKKTLRGGRGRGRKTKSRRNYTKRRKKIHHT